MLEDTKQTKVTKKIAESLKHGNEGQLGTKNNDECYTSANDILRELSQWAALGKFKDKNIICPCDWDIIQDKDTKEYGVLEYNGKRYTNVYAIKIEYDTNKFSIISNSVYKCVKSLQFMGLEFDMSNPQDEVVTIDIAEEDIESLLRNKLTCNFIQVLSQKARAWGIKSITASGYNPANGKGTPFQDIDYSKYDICITNPPFSLYGEFMKCLVGNIDFIVLAPFMNRNTPSVAVPLMEHKAYLGFGVHLALKFDNPTKNNLTHIKSVACDWLVSYPEAQAERNRNYKATGIKYETYKDEFIEMPNMTMKDGSHPIRVGGSAYPEDYSGWMFGGINILDSLDQENYEWISTNCKKYFNTTKPELNPFSHKLSDSPMLLGADGKNSFHGLLFRKKETK